MTHPNEDLVRLGFEAYGRGDVQALMTEFFSPDIIWHMPGRGPLAGDHAGADAVGAHFARVAELSGGTHRVELHDVIGNDDHVVALHAARAERAGKQLDVNRAGRGELPGAWRRVSGSRSLCGAITRTTFRGTATLRRADAKLP